MAESNPKYRPAQSHDWHDEARKLRRELKELAQEHDRLRVTLSDLRVGLDSIASFTDEATTREDARAAIEMIDDALDRGDDCG